MVDGTKPLNPVRSVRQRKGNDLLTNLSSDSASQFIGRISMQLLVSRKYPVTDDRTMVKFVGHERLFRRADGSFLLYLSSVGKPEARERVVWLDAREAIAWLNEAPEHFDYFWDFVEFPSPSQFSDD